jgi:hypothetical protein
LKDVKLWINSGELLRAFREWKVINDEGEIHFDPKHRHGEEGRPRFRRAPAMKIKKDL